MALKQNRVVIDSGRDKGKVFIIDEAPIAKQEDFAMRFIFAAMNSGMSIPDEVAGMGISGLIGLGFAGFMKIPYEMAKPLFAEMMTCVSYQVDPRKPETARPLMFDGDVEDLTTMFKLRKEVWDIHTSFIKTAGKSTSDTSHQPAATS